MLVLVLLLLFHDSHLKKKNDTEKMTKFWTFFRERERESFLPNVFGISQWRGYYVGWAIFCG